jgi:8-oxo-dGTP pyrophosphatase MutT (NUDIX family)
VLVPLYVSGGELHAVFTRRREDLRRHPGEISFPGGRQDDDETDLRLTGPARGRGGDRPARARGRARRRPAADADHRHQLRRLSLRRAHRARHGVAAFGHRGRRGDGGAAARLRAGYERRRLLRRGVPFRTDVYVVGEDVIWGATARMVGDLLERLPDDLA